LRASHARTLPPAALASVSFGFVFEPKVEKSGVGRLWQQARWKLILVLFLRHRACQKSRVRQRVLLLTQVGRWVPSRPWGACPVGCHDDYAELR